MVPMGRIAQAEEVALAVAFLLALMLPATSQDNPNDRWRIYSELILMVDSQRTDSFQERTNGLDLHQEFYVNFCLSSWLLAWFCLASSR